jgi:CRP/FNR family cyclic AMP-dependent transcriptional regulator
MPLLKTVRRWFSDPAFARKKAFLRSLDIFKDLRDRDLGPLVSALHTRTYREGEEVFVEGDIGRALFILESGRVELTRRGKEGRPETLYTLRPGDFFGEMALLESLPRSATAVALERCQLHLLYRTKLDALLHAQPRIGVEIMSHLARLLSSRLRRLNSDGKLLPPRKE